jgi:hypothetical protein
LTQQTQVHHPTQRDGCPKERDLLTDLKGRIRELRSGGPRVQCLEINTTHLLLHLVQVLLLVLLHLVKQDKLAQVLQKVGPRMQLLEMLNRRFLANPGRRSLGIRGSLLLFYFISFYGNWFYKCFVDVSLLLLYVVC